MRFTKKIDLWSLTDEQIAALQTGQWVTAGPDGARGRFFGKGASVVVAWEKRLPRGSRYSVYLKRYAEFGRAARKAA